MGPYRVSTGAASTPSLLDEIRAEVRGAGTTCTPGLFIAKLSATDQAAIADAKHSGIPVSAIGRWLNKARGYTGTPETVVRHLTGRCKCPTP